MPKELELLNILTALTLKTRSVSSVDQVHSPFPWLIHTSDRRNIWDVLFKKLILLGDGADLILCVTQLLQSPKNSVSNSKWWGLIRFVNTISKQAIYIPSAVKSLFCHLKSFGLLSKKNQMTLDTTVKSSNYSKNVCRYLGTIRYY